MLTSGCTHRRKIDIASLSRKIENKIGGYRIAYSKAKNADCLDRVLNSLKREIMIKVYSDIFGRDVVNSLSRETKKFLTID